MPELTPSQTVGPFFHIELTSSRGLQTDLVRDDVAGERITVEGTIVGGDGAPISDAMVEIWQANAAGRYNHPADQQDKPLDRSFIGFGRAETDENGFYRFRTIKPGPVPGRGNSLQAPHINFSIFARGLLKQLRTRMYFGEEPSNENDPVLALVPDQRRPTIVAKRLDGQQPPVYRFDIVLQGAGETVFFDV